MANEVRLIDANVMREDWLENGENEYVYDTNAVLNSIDAQPTVDAVEVVHGRWEDMYGGKYANPRYRCSVCKEKALFKFERDVLDNWKEVQALTPNCPYCMAKLDGERKDNDNQ